MDVEEGKIEIGRGEINVRMKIIRELTEFFCSPPRWNTIQISRAKSRELLFTPV